MLRADIAILHSFATPFSTLLVSLSVCGVIVTFKTNTKPTNVVNGNGLSSSFAPVIKIIPNSESAIDNLPLRKVKEVASLLSNSGLDGGQGIAGRTIILVLKKRIPGN